VSPPPAGVTCPPNTEFQAQKQKEKKTGIVVSCVACPAGQYTPSKVCMQYMQQQRPPASASTQLVLTDTEARLLLLGAAKDRPLNSNICKARQQVVCVQYDMNATCNSSIYS
jgi:hypothetical protein